MSSRQDIGLLEEVLKSGTLPATLGDFIQELATKFKDRVACHWFQDDRMLTFGELNEQATCLASTLNRLGARKGTHIAVLLPNLPETLVTWVAIARLGAVMVPINVNYTPTELAFILNDSDSQYIVIHDSLLPVLHKVGERPTGLVDQNIIVVGQAGDNQSKWAEFVETGNAAFVPPSTVTGSDLLNIQYTSGTTGFPKGCMLPHEYWIRTGYSLAFTRGDSPIENVLVWAPFYYMDGMWQILSAFFLGATAFVARRMSISQFFVWLREYRIHSCTFPEPALKAHPQSPDDALLNLKYIYSFGWRPDSKREAESRFGCIARDAYGMTELGTATITPFDAGERNFERTCGTTAPQRSLKVMRQDGSEAAPGEIGELWVSGPGIMWGYYKRPQANAEVFRGEWFRTGDYFRRDDSGYFFIVGRMKDSVRRSGENIAAREVEAVINEIDQVSESAVVGVPDEIRGEEVKVYIRLRDGLLRSSCEPQAVIAHCRQHLSAFKVPRYVGYVDDFPRTPTGKVSKSKLIEGVTDLRVSAYDRLEKLWR